jgi:hypothetical protein
MNEDLAEVPQLIAFRDRDRWRVWCEHCRSDHFHRQLGLQRARCPGYTPFTAHGYILVEGQRFHPSKTVYLQRKL